MLKGKRKKLDKNKDGKLISVNLAFFKKKEKEKGKKICQKIEMMIMLQLKLKINDIMINVRLNYLKLNKTSLNVIRQIGNKAGNKNFPTAKELLDSKQKPAKVIQLKPKK